MSSKAITLLRTLLDNEDWGGLEVFRDETQAALTELEANAYVASLVRPSLEAAFLRCVSVAYGGIAAYRQNRRRELARNMFVIFHEETGLTKSAMLAHIDKTSVSWRFPGREDARTGVESSVT